MLRTPPPFTRSPAASQRARSRGQSEKAIPDERPVPKLIPEIHEDLIHLDVFRRGRFCVPFIVAAGVQKFTLIK